MGIDFRRQNLTSKVDPRAVWVNKPCIIEYFQPCRARPVCMRSILSPIIMTLVVFNVFLLVDQVSVIRNEMCV